MYHFGVVILVATIVFLIGISVGFMLAHFTKSNTNSEEH